MSLNFLDSALVHQLLSVCLSAAEQVVDSAICPVIYLKSNIKDVMLVSQIVAVNKGGLFSILEKHFGILLT